MIDWILTFSYWVHLLATVVWLGGMMLLAVIAWPAWRAQSLSDNQWLALQKRFAPWVNGSMALLWVTGFVQMTNNVNYTGFLAIDSTWAAAILLKHVAVVAMMAATLYLQFRVYPAMERLQLLAAKKPQTAAQEQVRLQLQERRWLWINLVCAAVILFFTAVATAV
jgi:uncharacterized membrane protein